MHIFFGIFLLFLIWADLSHAQNISITMPCDAPVEYQSDDAEYKPGVDVDGNPVVPADAGGHISKPLAYPLRIPVQLDILRFLDLDLPESIDDSGEIDDVELAYFEIYEDGSIFYNNEELTDRVSTSCDERIESEEIIKIEENTDEGDGLAQEEAVPSSPLKPPVPVIGEKLEGQYP